MIPYNSCRSSGISSTDMVHAPEMNEKIDVSMYVCMAGVYRSVDSSLVDIWNEL